MDSGFNMVDFISAFRGAGTPGAPGVGSVAQRVLGGQQAQQQQDILGQLGQLDPGQALQSNQLAQLAVTNPDMAAKISQNFQGIDDQRQKALFEDAASVDVALSSGNTEQAIGLLEDRLTSIGQLGGDPSDTVEIFQLLASGDPQDLAQATALVKSSVRAGQIAGVLPDTPTSKYLGMSKDETRANFLLPSGEVISEPIAGATAGDDENSMEVRKEVRKDLRTRINTVEKDSEVLQANFNKITGLSEKIRGGNRTAVAQGLVALVKLGDPTSVVKDSEMIAALNNTSPVAAVASLLSSKGASEDVSDSILKKIDPLNPFNINVDDLLATANTLVLANVPGIQERFAGIEETAKSNLKESGIKSLFTKSLRDRVTGLSGLVPVEVVKPKTLADLTADDLKNLSDEELKALTGGQ